MTSLIAHDGFTLPPIGLGTYKLNGLPGVRAVREAIANGYTLLDSAFNYENEGAVGAAVNSSDVDPASLIVTSKLPGRHHDYDEALRTIEESVLRLGVDRIGLYLIHWPNPKVGKYVEAWKALIAARDAGLVGAIGVSNFLPEHLERLEDETGVRPAVNQIELHPYFPQEEAVAYHREKGILIEAWSPVGRGVSGLTDPAVLQAARRLDVSPVEAVLAWHVARGVVPLPKSADPRRQRANLAAADLVLTPEEIAGITALGRPDGRLKDQDPAEYEEF